MDVPASLLRALPSVALAAGAAAFAWLVVRGLRRGLSARPLLLAALGLTAVPVFYVGLVWAGLLSEGYLRFARVWPPVLGLAAVYFIAIRLAAHPRKQSPARRRAGDVLAPLAALAAALAAGGPELGRPLDRLSVLVAVDRSRSIDLVPNADQRIETELRVAELGMKPDDRIGTVAFGAEAMAEDPPRPKSTLGSPQRAAVGRDGTDLAAAIRRSLAEVPPDSAARIVLLSDGVATRGDTMGAAAAALASDIPIDVVPLEQRKVPDVRVVALRAPPRADEGEALDLRLVTSSPARAEVEIRVKRDGELVGRARATIAAGEDVLRLREKASTPGLHRYDVEITALDPKLDEAAEDNSGSAFVRVRGMTSALVLEGDPGQGEFVAHALERSSFRVDQASATGVPTDLAGFAAYDVVVLSDVPASALSAPQIEALASYVRDTGGGLILLGGDRGMGPGGYAHTAVEEVSPVSFDLKQDKRRASLSEVIGIDISGSMGATVGTHNKLELANEAAARSAALLGEGDSLGVEHVNTEVHWSVPLAPVKDKAAIEKAIRAVGVGGGGIYVDITLDAGYDALAKAKTNLKHMLLFADGSDAERKEGCRPKVAKALKGGITTSIVALGDGSDVPELEQLSRIGGGRFYLVEDAERLPAVFAQETILASRAALVEKDFRVARGAASSVTSSIDFGEAPALKGYVVTIPKPRASVLLTGFEGDPVLATWAAGVGRAAAFTSDLKDRWGTTWTTWPGAAKMIGLVARDVARREDDARVRLEADASGGELHVRASVVGDDGRAQSFRRFVVHVAGPDGFAHELVLEAAGAGAYVATLPLMRPGAYLATARDEGSGEAVGTTGAVLGAGEELRPTGSDLALLARIAELTGGKRRDTLAGIFADRAKKRFAYEDATAALLFFAAFGLLVMVAVRRVSLPENAFAWASTLRAAFKPPVEAPRRDASRKPESAPSPVGIPGPPPGSARAVTPAAAAAAPKAAAPVASKPAEEAPPPSSSRPMTAAEILLARRKGRRP